MAKRAGKRAMQPMDADEKVAPRKKSIFHVERMPLEPDQVDEYYGVSQTFSSTNTSSRLGTSSREMITSRTEFRKSAYRVERDPLPRGAAIDYYGVEKRKDGQGTNLQLMDNNQDEWDGATGEEPTLDEGNRGKEGEDFSGQLHEDDGEATADIDATTAAAAGKKAGTHPSGKRAEKKEAVKGKAKHLSFAHSIHAVHKQCNPGVQLHKQSVVVLHSILEDMMRRFAEDGAELAKFAGRPTLLSRDIEASAKMLLPGQLSKYALIDIHKVQKGKESNLEN